MKVISGFVALIAMACLHRSAPVPAPPAGPFATVSRDSAVLLFPGHPRRLWPVNLDSVPRAFEYRWLVGIPRAPQMRGVGFVLARIGDRPDSLPLARLLQRARIVSEESAGGPYVTQLDSAGIVLRAIDNRPAIVLRTRDAVARFFDQRPSYVLFVRITSGQPTDTDSVIVHYR